jgi:pimeloyl-ACP methyl ester carboxylesterase
VKIRGWKNSHVNFKIIFKQILTVLYLCKFVVIVQQKFITYQSSKIFYRITGNGKLVILLHGFGEEGTIWQNQIEVLKNHFQLIVPDLPGSGKSEIIANMSIEGMAEVIKDIINIELPGPSPSGGGWVGAIGHSMGGYITLALAEKYPHLIKAFGLFHSSAFADSEEKKATRLKAIEFIKKNGAYEFLKTSIPGLFLNPENYQPCIDLIEKAKQFTPEALIQYYQAMIARPNRTEVLKNFSGPILFIIGEHDKAIPFEQSLQQCYLPTQSHIHILRNSAHMGMWEEIEQSNIALLQFLKQTT